MPEASGLTDDEILARFHAGKRRPPCSQAVGLEVLRLSQSDMTVQVVFDAPEAWCNPTGALQGGFVTALLDEAMAVAGIVAGGLRYLVPTLELKVSFLRPCPPGRLEATGRVIRWGRKAAFIEADLFDGEGRVVARASSTVLPTLIERG